MKFKLKPTKGKNGEKLAVYKTLYIKQVLVDQIDKIASENDTSFNNVVISMIESCLSDEGEEA